MAVKTFAAIDVGSYELAIKIFEISKKMLTAAAGTADPEVFVIGGGLSNAGIILLNRVQFYYRKYAFHAFRNTPFALAKLGNDAGIYGCAKMIL